MKFSTVPEFPPETSAFHEPWYRRDEALAATTLW
jgi:hypothetical protein